MIWEMELHEQHEGAGAQAPEPGPGLRLLQEFVNTNDIQGEQDELATPDLLGAWLTARQLIGPDQRADAAAHRSAIAIREGLRALGDANNNGEPADPHRLEALNQAASQLPMVVDVGPDAWRLRPVSQGVDGFLAGILGTLARAMADGSWMRVKSCRRDTCRWLFFDQSRNRSGTWCSMAGCGSRMKARAYRARRREAASA
jgi:predicted RNA-binding Zn ribbon-like protein